MTPSFDIDKYLESRLKPQDQSETPVVTLEAAKQQPWLFIVLAVLIVAGATWWVLKDRVSPGPGPGPGPSGDVELVVSQAVDTYSANLAIVMDELANKIDSGQITTVEQLATNARAMTQAAREKAFAEHDKLDNANLSDFEKTRAAAYLRRKAEGFRAR